MMNFASKQRCQHTIKYGYFQSKTTEVNNLTLGSGVDIFLKMNTSPRSYVVTWDSEDDIANDIDDGQRVYRNFAGTYFPGASLETVKVVYEALALKDGVMRPVQNQFYGWTHPNPILRV